MDNLIRKEKRGMNPKSLKNLKPIEKGSHALPGSGRPKGVKTWATVFREILALPPEDIEEFIGKRLPEHLRRRANQELIALQIMTKALSGDLQAADRLMDRMDGRPKETMAVEQPEGVDINSLPTELRKELLTELLNQIEEKK